MSPRARLLLLPTASAVVAALVWTSLGTLVRATAQEKPTVIGRAHRGSNAPTFDEPIFLLMLGGDAHKGNPQRVRMDAIHIVAIDPVRLRATIVGIPRDSYVEIPGRSGKDKINDAGAFGGPDLMVKTVENLSGCRFDYYTHTNFTNFRRMVDEFGGITMKIERRLFESCCSRINLFPGVQRLDGVDALAFARNRHNVGSDFVRSENQGKLMVAALAEARKDFRSDVATPLRALGALRRNVHTQIPLVEALRLGLLAMRLDPKKVDNFVVDGTTGSAGGASIVNITAEGQHQLFDVCKDAIRGND